MGVTCYIAVGSNLGDRRKNILSAIKKIKALKDTKVLKVSKLIETNPVGGPCLEGKFLNGALKIETKISPRTLLNKFKKIEQELGRTKSAINRSRTIDLDILLYSDKIINTKKLVIPHKRMFEREFVLKPLTEVI